MNWTRLDPPVGFSITPRSVTVECRVCPGRLVRCTDPARKKYDVSGEVTYGMEKLLEPQMRFTAANPSQEMKLRSYYSAFAAGPQNAAGVLDGLLDD